ncbi:MAG TPA: heavy metal-binding domain-containing protein [Bryobacteraceae bacterium]|nr:heavy metal-binding domain-containing protein [Bryobacteraceae bacterium]
MRAAQAHILRAVVATRSHKGEKVQYFSRLCSDPMERSGCRMEFLKREITTIGALFAGITLGLGTTSPTPPQASHENNPATVPAPMIASRSLAMLWQVVKQLENFVRDKNLAAIHNEDLILGAAANELLAEAGKIVPARSDDFKAKLTAFCSQVSALHLMADLNQQAASEAELAKVLASFEKLKGYFPKEIVARAQKYLEAFSCPMHRDVIGKRSDVCPKCGMLLDQMVRVLPSASGPSSSGQQTVRASVKTATPLIAGKPVTALLRLQRANGDPVPASELIETHTKKVHLLIVDNSLTDYHHQHPEPTRNPGEYAFTFTPNKPGSYRLWADIRPLPLGLEEYVMTDIPAATVGEPLRDRAVNLRAKVDGLNYELILPQTIQAGRPAAARLRITTPDGKGFTQLEPFMGAFAHLVGFNEDLTTVMHIHPKGPPAADPAARGGPELEFQIYALRPGFVRLFAQVQIAGRTRSVPFGIQVSP